MMLTAESGTGQSKLANLWKKLHISGAFVALVIIIFIAAIASPYFLTAYNLQSVVRNLAFVSIIGLGQACLLILGELDLSVGPMAGLCGVIGGMLMVNAGVNPYLSFALMLLIGAAFGFVNGVLVAGLGLNSLVATIGMSGVYRGINLVISKGRAITGIPKQIHFLGQGDLLGVPMPFVVMLIVLVGVVFLTRYTPFGRYMYAIGNSSEAASILGIRVSLVRIVTYMLVGVLSALAGMLMVARLGSAQPSIGEAWVLNSIAASVIGGVATTGGVGSPAGALMGAAIIGVIENIIVLFGVSPYWQTAVSGVIVVGAISLDSISRIFASRRRLGGAR
ncbi:MAG TPA: ABC transporter permease [Firmicutes bacterium]|nr:ABC transporter permease [Bacillota bacterium]